MQLREHFDLASMLGYYDNGRLYEWLTDRYYENEAEKINKLDSSASDFKKQLCAILGVGYAEEASGAVELTDIAARNARRERLKQFTADDTILAAVDSVAFSQEELADLLDEDITVIYLCGERFKIPGSKSGVKYIGVNNPEVDAPQDFSDKGIVFQNVFIADEIIRLAKEAEEAEDSSEAIRLWRIAAERGNAEAQCHLGGYYIEENIDEAMKWIRKSTEQGFAMAQFCMGAMFIGQVEGIEKNLEEAEKWFRQAAEQGLVRAQIYLALYCDNYDALNSNAEAQYELAQSYDRNSWDYDVERNITEAIKWYHKAAEQGHAKAQVVLGAYYYVGEEEIEQNKEEAIKWFRKAAEQGNIEALASLVLFCEDKNALRTLMEIAGDGDMEAQCYLGDAYLKGNGIEKNVSEAIKWLSQSSEQGHAGASETLYHMYSKGDGVEVNTEEALKWLGKWQEQRN
jgi:TPR repeat protein